ncbi:histone-fold-containing protein [Flagelloscypha sp. PMI_526]|nr:histone-fold-containing protein [Flagelloscypha sp. PMI_526]
MKNKNKQTKFPVARIKKIMQKDEDVGKVAQATPIVISKALELFLGLVVEESSSISSSRGAKKVEAYHLKHAIETSEMLDFLKEIVQAVPDPSAGGTIDIEAEKEEKKKKRAAKKAGTGEPGTKRRRKKGDLAEPASETQDDHEMGDTHQSGVPLASEFTTTPPGFPSSGPIL